MKAVILAAGVGSRLGRPSPKALTVLSTGRTIMQHQIDSLVRYVDIEDVFAVVGFKKEAIMEAFPQIAYVYNEYFDATNTAKSLLRALKKVRGHDVIWLNGDVVFDHRVIERICRHHGTCMAVNTASVADEEVKYVTAEDGTISKVSKTVTGALGEAVGINKVESQSVPLLIKHLESCEDNDYFEKGIETAIDDGLRIWPVDVSDLMCTEVDFAEDLERVNEQLLSSKLDAMVPKGIDLEA